MKRTFDISDAKVVYIEAPASLCGACGGSLWVCEHSHWFVQRLDGPHCLVRQNKWCHRETCERFHIIERVPHDVRFALPGWQYGFDVVLEIGERHLARGEALRAITRDLNARAVPLSQRHTSEVFRGYVSLAKAARGDDATLRGRLQAQGGVLLMADGVQFDANSPVLYIVWDAISGEPLFGERKPFKGAADLVPLLERVKSMGVPVIGAVSDKEKGLLPAMQEVFPDVPHQVCQFHFLKNCALGLSDDLKELGQGVGERAERVRKISKRLHKRGVDSLEHELPRVDEHSRSETSDAEVGGAAVVETAAAAAEQPQRDDPPRAEPEPLTEEQLAAELCAMTRHAARAAGRAPLNPPELVRHERLEAVRAVVNETLKKGATTPFSSRSRAR
jgi:hypothetical protein